MFGYLRALYLTHPRIVAYMLQSSEYQTGQYLRWYWRTQNFAHVMRRRKLDRTRRAQAVLWALRASMGLQLAAGIALFVWGFHISYVELMYFGFALAVSYPVIWAHLIVVPLFLAKVFYVQPRQQKAIAASEQAFLDHPGTKVAIAGSYGKTTMKELLQTILGEGLKVAATPANKNVAISHAAFVRKLDGDERVLLIEYGEDKPGDIARFARITHPDYAFITGLAPVHMEGYKTFDAVAADLASITEFIQGDHLFANGESPELDKHIKAAHLSYSQKGIGDWKVSDVKVTINGTTFTLGRGKEKLQLSSSLLGRHQVGPLSAAAALAVELGIPAKKVAEGIANTKPFEHRMFPYNIGGATIIDDTYNGNLEGIRAGTRLLGELHAKRKWYVTPGLVEQGELSEKVHKEMGGLIAAAKPDVVVLMQNSVTPYIEVGLKEAGFDGELRIETEPLAFYTNLEHFVSAGDLLLLQNDWTDNYA